MAAFAAVFGMSFTACSNNDDLADAGSPASGETRGIGFDININGNAVATRGVATTTANVSSQITEFRTWAYDDVTKLLYMGDSDSEGRTVEYKSSRWEYVPEQFWPVNPLNFVAVTPDSDASYGTFSTTTTSNASPATDSYVTLSVPVTLDTDVEDQKDIMFAEGDGKTKVSDNGNVRLEFKHALSQIVFQGKLPTSGAVTKVTIAEITLGNIGSTGTLEFTSEGTFFGGSAYISTGAPDNFTLEAGDLEGETFEVGTGGVTAGTAFDLTVSNSTTKPETKPGNAWFMLPQRTAAWTPASDADKKAGALWDSTSESNNAPATGAYLKIRAQLEKDGVVILGNAEKDAIYIPLTANWDRSKKYVYTILFDGTSALTPITFSVTAQNWTDADAYYEWSDITATVNAPQDMSSYLTVAGNFSGITALDDNHYAVVDDKSTDEGWYPVNMTFAENGAISSLTQGSFVAAASGLTNQDNEAIAYNPARNTMFLTREMGDKITEYNTDGTPTGSHISTASFSGITSNAGFEALTYNRNLRKFYTTTERPTSADAAGAVRIAQYDGESLLSDGYWYYTLEEALYSPATGDTYAKGVSDLCALDDGRLLVLEREALVSPSNFSAKTITKIFIVNPAKASQGTTLEKTLLTSWTTTDNTLSLLSKGYFDFANYEGICLGPRMNDGSRLLILLTDSQNRYSVGPYSLKDFWRTIRLYGI